VEESAAAAESLNQQAARLVDAVSVFVLSPEGRSDVAQQRTIGVKSPSHAKAVTSRLAPARVASPRPAGAATTKSPEWASF
jgi:methyl-accepting chemotaxis protein